MNVEDFSIPAIDPAASSEFHVNYINLKNFRGLLRKTKNQEDFQVFQVVQKGHLTGFPSAKDVNRRLDKLLLRYEKIIHGRVNRLTASRTKSRSPY